MKNGPLPDARRQIDRRGRMLEIERRKFRELPEEWADRAYLRSAKRRQS
jgi:hypothetical protein